MFTCQVLCDVHVNIIVNVMSFGLVMGTQGLTRTARAHLRPVQKPLREESSFKILTVGWTDILKDRTSLTSDYRREFLHFHGEDHVLW